MGTNSRAKARSRFFRAIMRQHSMAYRENVRWARRYQEYNPALHEQWLIKAGVRVALAVAMRDDALREEGFLPHSLSICNNSNGGGCQ
jgi:hypothetical protein